MVSYSAILRRKKWAVTCAFAIIPWGGKEVGITQFLRVVVKVADLHPALLDQGGDAIVDFSDADTELTGELPLAQLGLLLDALEQAVANFVGDFGGHGADACSGRGHATAPC
jgi:hypothetical protein